MRKRKPARRYGIQPVDGNRNILRPLPPTAASFRPKFLKRMPLAVARRIPHVHPVLPATRPTWYLANGKPYLDGFGGLFLHAGRHEHTCRTNNDGWSKLDIETFGAMLEARNRG